MAKINIDQKRINEYEGAKDWGGATDLTPKWEGAKDWTPPVYAEGEEPPLQWLLDAALPFLVGGGAGAAYVGRKEIGKQALKVLNKIKGTPAKSAIPRGVPLYDKAGKVIGVDSRTVPYSSVKDYLKKSGPSQARWGGDVSPYKNPFSVKAGLELGLKDNINYLSKMPNVAKEAYKASRIKQQKELADRLSEVIKGSEKYHRTALRDYPKLQEGSKWGSAWKYGVPSSGTKQEYKAAGHAVKSMLKSNPEFKKKATDKIIDALLGID